MIELKGDILLVENGIICHQVNCLGIMGAGLAKQIKNKFPEAYQEYHKMCLRYLELSPSVYVALGKVQIYIRNKNLLLANIFGQCDTGPGKRTSYNAVDEALSELQIIYNNNYNDLDIFFPKNMGSALGGGNWKIYSAIIENYFPNGIIIDYKKGKIPCFFS